MIKNIYPTILPYYSKSDIDDDYLDYLCNDSDEWAHKKDGVLDNSLCILDKENPYKFTTYLWVYYDESKDFENTLKHFKKDFLEYSFNSEDSQYIEDDLYSLHNSGITEPYLKYIREYDKYDNSGNSDNWKDMYNIGDSIILPYRYNTEINIYRSISLDRNRNGKLDLSNLGNCWSLSLKEARKFGSEYSTIKNGHSYIIEGECSPLNVDWVMSLLLKMRFPGESELRIIDPNLIHVTNIYDEESKDFKINWVDGEAVISKISDE